MASDERTELFALYFKALVRVYEHRGSKEGIPSEVTAAKLRQEIDFGMRIMGYHEEHDARSWN